MAETVHLDHFSDARIRSSLERQVGPELVESLETDLPADLSLEGWWCLTLIGPNGAGKSWLAVRVLAELVRMRHEAFGFQSCPALATSLRGAIAEGGMASHSILSRLIEMPLLVLDDVMRIRHTDYMRSTLVELLHQRHQWQRLTVLTCDESPRSLDPAVYSRLQPERGGLVYQVKRRD